VWEFDGPHGSDLVAELVVRGGEMVGQLAPGFEPVHVRHLHEAENSIASSQAACGRDPQANGGGY
jgi:hypothetical protein